jgi:deoxyribodipyrimidine photolyase
MSRKRSPSGYEFSQ